MKLKTYLAAILVVASAVQSARSAEPVKTEVADDGLVADFYATEGSTKHAGILLLGGSEGGKPDAHLSKLFVDQGYPLLSLAYFKTKGLPDSLEMIPLEYFDKAIHWMQANEHIDRNKIVAIGGSKGAELALLLASNNPAIKGVIAISPSSVVWQGIPAGLNLPKSSWSVDSRPVPYLPFDVSGGVDFNALAPLHRLSLTHEDDVTAATIEVEKINGPILLLSGQDDTMWPAAEMGDAVVSRLNQKGFKFKVEHIKYEDAGHAMNEHLILGGTSAGNRKARIDTTHRALQFLTAIEQGQ